MPALLRRPVAAAIVLSVLVLLATVVSAGAAEARSGAPTSSAPVMVVLDASGSMRATDAPGPRIAAAKRAVTRLVDRLPADARIGLEVYGTSTGSASADRTAGCRDVRVVLPVAPMRKAAFGRVVRTIRASGYTPIGRALQRAAAALPASGPRSVVLVSDGEDTCAPPDPCDVARDLKRQGVDLTVHTIGFKVDEQARRQLRCVADVTGGTYRDADDGGSLADELDHGVQRGLQPYAVAGTPINGADTAAGSPELTPGQYLDTLARGEVAGVDGTAKYYTIHLRRGESPHLFATVVPPATRANGLYLGVRLELTDLADSGCSFYDSGYDIGIYGKVTASTAVLDPGEVGGPDWPSQCPTDGAFAVRVTRTGNVFGDRPLKVEVGYRVEQPADAGGLPGAAGDAGGLRARVSGTAHAVRAGSSFNDAPLVRSGVYRDTLVSGETRFYKVHLDWGQRLAYVITPAHLRGHGILDGASGRVEIVNPMRDDLDQASGSSSSAAFLGTSDTALSGSTLAPVRFTNRFSDDSGIAAYDLAGDYYLTLSTGFPSAGENALQIPYTVAIDVVGTPERGPVYGVTPRTVPTQTPTGSPTGSPTQSPTRSATQSPTRHPGSGTASHPSTVAARAADHTTSGPGTGTLLATVAAGLLVCGAAGGVFTVRRRNAAGRHG